ncbi:COP9 signalosome complex subunit 7b isoform X3 [Panulirus ornatus]|uniref:COP9 signalosome complex subunit 7b isoform X3 n=1 Tax=Panulirus ornatus TaxID=150431 RepID=UPI003A84EEAD
MSLGVPPHITLPRQFTGSYSELHHHHLQGDTSLLIMLMWPPSKRISYYHYIASIITSPITMSAANMTAEDNSQSKTMGEKPSQTNPMEQYILLAKQAKGAAAVQLVKQVLEAPEVYVFGELLDMPNITNLKNNPQHAPYFELLHLFAYGVYGDYVRESSKFPALTPTMLTKLRHLTIVSMATGQKSIPLVTLGNQLGLTSTRELEDLIIEAMYTGKDIIHGKLDQKNGILELDHAIGRDIKSEDLPNIVATLQSWCDTCDTMLSNIDQLITRANSDKEKHLKHRNSLETEI